MAGGKGRRKRAPRKDKYAPGMMYVRGWGTPREREKAKVWIARAAQAGEPQAMRLMGEMAHGGFGLARNGKTALFWYRKSAEAGNREAMQRLAAAYGSGSPGLAAGLEQAKRWQARAAKAESAEPLLPAPGAF